MPTRHAKNGAPKMTSTTSRRLTETLKRARKERYFTKMGDLANFAFAWKWPQHIDWIMTGFRVGNIYNDITRLVDDMADEGKTLTAYQQHLFED